MKNIEANKTIISNPFVKEAFTSKTCLILHIKTYN